MPVKLEACNADIMFAALQRLKLGPWRDNVQNMHLIFFGNGESIDCDKGQATLATFRDINEIKRNYSAATLEQTAADFGWQLTQTEGNQFELTAQF